MLTIYLRNGSEITFQCFQSSFINFRNWYFKKDSNEYHEFLEETDDEKYISVGVKKKHVIAFKYESDNEINSEEFENE